MLDRFQKVESRIYLVFAVFNLVALKRLLNGEYLLACLFISGLSESYNAALALSMIYPYCNRNSNLPSLSRQVVCETDTKIIVKF